jgi:hypothetical protein
MILIEVNNSNTTNNSELIAKTTNWAEANIKDKYVIVLNPNVEGEMRITHHTNANPQWDLHWKTSNAPHGTNMLDKQTHSDTNSQHNRL